MPCYISFTLQNLMSKFPTDVYVFTLFSGLIHLFDLLLVFPDCLQIVMFPPYCHAYELKRSINATKTLIK